MIPLSRNIWIKPSKVESSFDVMAFYCDWKVSSFVTISPSYSGKFFSLRILFIASIINHLCRFRRGHGVYAVKHSQNFEEFQAYSQNMGHEDPGTTFKYYSKLSHNDIRDVILRRK